MSKRIKIDVEFDFDNALARSQAEPLVAVDELRGALKKGRGGYYRTLREAMATCCTILQNLRPNETDWRAFLSKVEEAETPYNPRENPDLAAVVFYAFPRTSYTQCIKYAAGLQLLIDEGVEPPDMPTVIKERGGIDELYREATGKKRDKTGASIAARVGSTKSSKRGRPRADDVSRPGTAEDEDVRDHSDDLEEAAGGDEDPGEDDPAVVGATAKAKKKAARLAGKLARIAVTHGTDWILCELVEQLFEAIIQTAASDMLSLAVENLGPAKNGLVRFRIFGFTHG